MKIIRGFSLIEMAVVILIIGLLVGPLLVPLGTQVEQRRVAETQKTLDEIKEALLGHALAKNHLPCPDLTAGAGSNDGTEDFNAATGVCSGQEGNIPWTTLGIPQTDPWGQRFHYRVTPAFSNRIPASSFSLSSNGDIRICQAAGCTATQASANSIPAIVLSYGKNGAEILACPNAARADECENRTADTTFTSRFISAADSPAGEFDDVVVWLSPNILFNRMVAAGKLP